MKLCLSVCGELFVIDLEQVLYLQADDHYTHVYYASDVHFMIPFGLSAVETSIKENSDESKNLIRVGRKYIVNLKKVYHVNVLKQMIVLGDDDGKSISLHISQAALQSLVEAIKSGS